MHTAGEKNLSTGIRFKQVILKGFLRLDLQPVQLISQHRSQTKNPPCSPPRILTIVLDNYELDGLMQGAFGGRAAHVLGFPYFFRNVCQHYSRMSDAQPASRIQSKLVSSGSCGTFPCVFMFLQNLTRVSRSIARSCALRPCFGTV